MILTVTDSNITTPSIRLTGLPLCLLGETLFLGLCLHLLHLDGVGFASPHVELMVAHAERQDTLVDSQARRVENEVLQANNKSLPSRGRH